MSGIASCRHGVGQSPSNRSGGHPNAGRLFHAHLVPPAAWPGEADVRRTDRFACSLEWDIGLNGRLRAPLAGRESVGRGGPGHRPSSADCLRLRSPRRTSHYRPCFGGLAAWPRGNGPLRSLLLAACTLAHFLPCLQAPHSARFPPRAPARRQAPLVPNGADRGQLFDSEEPQKRVIEEAQTQAQLAASSGRDLDEGTLLCLVCVPRSGFSFRTLSSPDRTENPGRIRKTRCSGGKSSLLLPPKVRHARWN